MTREEFTGQHPELVAFLTSKNAELSGKRAYGPFADFIFGLHGCYRRYGHLTPKQVTALERTIQREADYKAEQERLAAERAAQPASPVLEGRVELAGVIDSAKWKHTQFGGCIKMTLSDDRGFRIWLTMPDAINEELLSYPFDPEAGLSEFVAEHLIRVRLTATVKSSDDPTFGYGSRPTRASVVSVNERS